jgi:PAS domain S-box-containing protein
MMGDRFRNFLSGWASLRTGDPVARRRGQLLNLFILCAVLALMVVTAFNVIEWLMGLPDRASYVATDVLSIALALGLWQLNRRGYVRLAAYLLLIGWIVATTTLLTFDVLDRELLLLAAPVILAGFVIRPVASLGFAALAAAGYLLAYSLSSRQLNISYIGLAALAVLAFIAWLVADRLERALAAARQSELELRRDIAARERVEAALRDGEERYRALAQNLGEGVSIVDTDDRFLLVNPAGAAIFGIDSDQLLGRSVREFVASDQLAVIEEHTARRQQGITSTYELEVRRADGDLRQLQVTGTPRFDSAGRLIGTFAIFRDITDLKRAEQAQRQLNAQLDLSNRQLMALYEIGRALAATLDTHEIYRALYREVAQRMLGAPHLAVALFDKTGQMIRGAFAIVDGEELDPATLPPMPLGDDLTSDTIRTRQPRIVDVDQSRAALLPPDRVMPMGDERRVRTALYAPLISGDEVIGVLSVQHYEPNAFNAAHLTLVATIASQAAVAIANAQFFATLEQRVADRTAQLKTINAELLTEIDERQRIEAALRESEERFRQIADNSHDVFWMTTLDRSRVLYVSPAYEEIWGRTSAELYSSPASFLESIYPDDRRRVEDYLARQQRGEAAFAEYRIVRPDGSIGWIWDRAFPVRNAAGEAFRMAGLAEDVTTRKQAEEELQRALAQEKELNELKSRFIATASHEFRTPLTAISTSAMLLEHYEHKLSAEKKQKHLQQIQASVNAMTRLLDDVLIIGRADAGRLEFSPAPLDLDQFCRDLVEEMQLNASARHTIKFSNHGVTRTLMLDEKLLRQILGNLLSNAIKYSPGGGSIEFDIDERRTAVVFTVADHGIGIPPEAQPRLFETFHRARNVGKIQGTGLGLAIVKKSVDMHRGTITFDSQIGVGTTFRVTLPVLSNMGTATKERGDQ